jgi:hypothetical protein
VRNAPCFYTHLAKLLSASTSLMQTSKHCILALSELGSHAFVEVLRMTLNGKPKPRANLAFQIDTKSLARSVCGM